MQDVLNCIIVDDEKVDRLMLVAQARRHPMLHILGVYASAEEARPALADQAVDVLFLDIDMPGITGLELRKQFEQVPACIFITSYADYAAGTYELEALDFIVKPLKAERFDKSMLRLENFMDTRKKAALFEYHLGGDVLFIKDGHDQVKIKVHEIMYLEALSNYTRIVTAHRKYTILSALSALLEQKAFQLFVRIHRSYAVQPLYIDKITAKEIFIQDIVLPVGRSYRSNVDMLKT